MEEEIKIFLDDKDDTNYKNQEQFVKKYFPDYIMYLIIPP